MEVQRVSFVLSIYDNLYRSILVSEYQKDAFVLIVYVTGLRKAEPVAKVAGYQKVMQRLLCNLWKTFLEDLLFHGASSTYLCML